MRSNSLKIRLLLESASLLVVLLFAFFSVQQMIKSTPTFDNDYKTFYMSLKNQNDFYQPHYYSHIHAILREKNKIIIQTQPPMSAINMNTPLMSMVLAKLIDYHTTLSKNIVIWVAVSLLCAMTSLVFFQTRYFFLSLLMIFFSWASVFDLTLGQISYFLLPILCFGFFLYEKKYFKSSAALLGLLAALKLFFVIFLLLYFVERQWKALFIFAGAFLLFSFLPLLNLPWSVYQHFFYLIQNQHPIIVRAALPMNGSLLGVVTQAVHFWHPASTDAQIRLCTTILCLYIVIRWLIFDYQTLSKISVHSRALRFSFLIILALICSPLGWEYYALFLFVPIVVLLRMSKEYRLPIGTYFFFTASQFFPYCAWFFSKNTIGIYLQSFAVFLSYLCFLATLLCLVHAIENGEKVICFDQKTVSNNNMLKQTYYLITIFIICALLSAILRCLFLVG